MIARTAHVEDALDLLALLDLRADGEGALHGLRVPLAYVCTRNHHRKRPYDFVLLILRDHLGQNVRLGEVDMLDRPDGDLRGRTGLLAPVVGTGELDAADRVGDGGESSLPHVGRGRAGRGGAVGGVGDVGGAPTGLGGALTGFAGVVHVREVDGRFVYGIC